MSDETRGRKAVFLNKESVEEALIAIHSGSFKSRYLTLKLVEMGLVELQRIRRRDEVVHVFNTAYQKKADNKSDWYDIQH